MEIDDISICETCKHRHELGTKCGICGHVGRSQILPKMKIKANARRALSIRSFKGSELDYTIKDVLFEIREMVYCNELNIPETIELNDKYESYCVHVVLLLGDAPIGLARYRIEQLLNINQLIIDKLIILGNYRHNLYCKYILKYILHENSQIITNNNIEIISQIPHITDNKWLIDKLQSYNFILLDNIATTNDIYYINMIHRGNKLQLYSYLNS